MISQLFTERLHLRKMNVSDSRNLFHIWSDPDVTKFMNINSLTEESQALEIIELLDKLDKDNKATRYTIIEQDTKKIIGTCGFNFLDFEHSKTELGYDIAKSAWGNGYAPEAIRSLLDHAFNNLGLNRVEAKVEPANINSIKVLQKLNFTFEGTLRQYEKSKGKFVDINMYSLLKDD
ncbi:GNAT family N-acetyltransferase [Bacillus solimangrovi]|uniref:GNAT family N-acetyltransferase n=1 Tax=Bacillus solimangrovi TaxID=1305675 RepID=A0A1E5LJF7_9BACI|nr:GNAT family protein [Bacillus solimangrovi]OEH94158.1 GNAT family N-acetyltransferase [Bacillus solimangrovi]